MEPDVCFGSWDALHRRNCNYTALSSGDSSLGRGGRDAGERDEGILGVRLGGVLQRVEWPVAIWDLKKPSQNCNG